jgi:hypothetical protein
MTEHPRPYLIDAAKQLEQAARRLRCIGQGGEYRQVALSKMREAFTLLDAAAARMKNAGSDLSGD